MSHDLTTRGRKELEIFCFYLNDTFANVEKRMILTDYLRESNSAFASIFVSDFDWILIKLQWSKNKEMLTFYNSLLQLFLHIIECTC